MRDYKSDFESEQRRCAMIAGDLASVEARSAQLKEALTQLRDAWNVHMATCNQDAHLVPTPEQIDAWRNAPSNTASALAPKEEMP
jgi:hypothetical protein